MIVSFAVPEHSSFMGSHLFNHSLWGYATNVLSRKILLVPMSASLFFLSLLRFGLAALRLKSLIPLELSFLQMTEMDLVHSSTCAHHLTAPAFAKDTVFSPVSIFDFHSNEVSTSREGCDVWVFDLIPLIMCLSAGKYHTIFIIIALYYNMTSGISTHLAVLLLLRTVLTVLSFLYFYMQLKIVLLNFYLELCWYFDGNCIESKDCFW